MMYNCLVHGLNTQPDCPHCKKGAWEGQEGGDHYKKLSIQPFEYSMKNKLDPIQHTVIKYVTRFRDKNGVEDLRKAIHCIELLIQYEEENGQ